MDNNLTWVEISKKSLTHNVQVFRGLIGKDRILCPAVKGNAYGHGLTLCAPLMVAAGADWVAVNALFEAVKLRESGFIAPIYIMGYIALNELRIAVEAGFHLVVYHEETVHKLGQITAELQKKAYTHLSVETGLHREGVTDDELESMLEAYRRYPLVELSGVAAHFANIEDTTDHSYAEFQLAQFEKTVDKITANGFHPKFIHTANTAAVILFSKTHFTMVRTGIGNYGLWPSNETYISALRGEKNILLKPVMTWKTKVAKIKKIPAGAYVGYGCTYKTGHDSVMAVLPVGYYDSYDRKHSNNAYVLIHGKRAPVRGRVFMNMLIVEITDIPGVQLEDEAVLLGTQGDETVSADQLAGWIGTIHYEVTTRISESLKRVVVE